MYLGNYTYFAPIPDEREISLFADMNQSYIQCIVISKSPDI